MFKRKNNKPADVVIGHIVLNNDCALRYNRAGMDNVINHFQAGISIGIGRAVTTLAGRSYRIANTTHWIMDSDCVADNAAISFAADNVDPIVRGGFVIRNTITPAMLNDVNEFTNVLNPDKIKNVSGKTLTAKKSVANPLTNNNNSKSKSRTMDKSALKSVINGLTPGQVVGITFVGERRIYLVIGRLLKFARARARVDPSFLSLWMVPATPSSPEPQRVHISLT